MIPDMLDYLLKYHFPEIWNDDNIFDMEDKYVQLFKKIIVNSTKLVAKW